MRDIQLVFIVGLTCKLSLPCLHLWHSRMTDGGGRGGSFLEVRFFCADNVGKSDILLTILEHRD